MVYLAAMAYTTEENGKLLVRVSRIRGQVEAIERALESERDCSRALRLMAAWRGG